MMASNVELSQDRYTALISGLALVSAKFFSLPAIPNSTSSVGLGPASNRNDGGRKGYSMKCQFG